MKFMILINGNLEGWTGLQENGSERLMAAHTQLFTELTASGELVETHELGTRPAEARVVRVADGAAVVTDGPFIEAKEIVAGYYIVDVASIDRATDIATRLIEAEFAPIEVRLIHDEPTG